MKNLASVCSLLIVVLALVVSCAAPLRDSLRQESFDGHEEDLIETAAAQWSKATGGSLSIVLDKNGLWLITEAALEGPVRGRTYYSSGRIGIDKEDITKTAKSLNVTYDTLFIHVVMHEIGHAAGIRGHIPGSPLMDKGSAADAVCVDQLALDALCKVMECGVGSTSTCRSGTLLRADSPIIEVD